MNEFKLDIAGKSSLFTIGEMAKQSDGSVFVNYGDTDFLVTVVKKQLKEDKGFFPLIINYEEKLYSVGKIPGNFQRREAKPSEQATINARLIDRPLRPLFPENFDHEVQIVVTVLGYDKDYESDMLSITAASLGCAIAGLPIMDLISGLTVSKVEDKIIFNPTLNQREEANGQLKIAGTKSAVNMIEFQGNEFSEKEVLEMIEQGHNEIKKIITQQEEILKTLNIQLEKYESKLSYDVDLYKEINSKYYDEFKEILKNNVEKKHRNKLVDDLKILITSQYDEEMENEISEIFETIYKELFVDLIVNDKYRVDGRSLEEVRALSSRVNVLKKAHGSALFTRGETQALAVCTLGIKNDEQLLDGLEDITNKNFLLHYNFPPYSVGEVGRMGAPGRREIGHGFLAEKALKPVLPSLEDFPYTIRLVSEILESNGSSSQATICASTMSLMNAGVPLKKPVSGIAMGLIKRGESYTILSDIAGLEDHLGDMDFKVAGTQDGITAIQMDIKIDGITSEIFEKCLEQAKEGRMHILKHMTNTIDKPEPTVNKNAPKIVKFNILKKQIKDVIGRGGDVINKIIEQTDVKIDIEEDGRVIIYGQDIKMVEEAEKIIKKITKIYEVGEKYPAKVIRIEKFGAFVVFDDGQEALLHISKLSEKRIEKVEDVLKLGDDIKVEIIEVDNKRLKVKLDEIKE